MENNNQSFRQFSDQLRHQTSNFANLSLNNSIWSNSYETKKPGERKNFDVRVGGDVNSLNNLDPKGSDFNGFNGNWGSSFKAKVSDATGFNDGWNSFKAKTAEISGFDDRWSGFKGKSSDLNAPSESWKIETIGFGRGPILGGGSQIQKSVEINGGFNKGIFPKPTSYNINNNNNINFKGYKNSGIGEDGYGGKGGKKNSNKKHCNENNNNNNNENKDSKNAADKRFKTLPASESLPRNETIGGYIFVCNNDTMQENLKRQLFGLPPRYRDSVRAITPGLPLFLYNYSTHQLHGVFEASSFGGTNIDPTAWEDKKCPGESRFPAQVKAVTRKIYDPLEEDSFRPILHHYDGPKFRLELNVPEALSLLDIFAEPRNA